MLYRQTEGHMPRTVFVVSRHHSDLFGYLRERFAGDVAVEIVMDRRIGERRRSAGMYSDDRRRRDRRSHPEVDAELQTRSHAIVTLPDPAME